MTQLNVVAQENTPHTSQRINSFINRFGHPHLYLAYHAAFPLALTPDMLYRLWATFPQDVECTPLNIPWIAVTDLLLSNLCKEVGHELYEMDRAVRTELLRQLQHNRRFGQQRIQEISDFLLRYVRSHIDSLNPDRRDFAQAQKWVALAYTQPDHAAHEIASTLADLEIGNRTEWLRLTSIVETFEAPLSEHQPLLIYAQSLKQFVRGNEEGAKQHLRKVLDSNNQVRVAGINLPIPEPLEVKPTPVRSLGRNIRNHAGIVLLMLLLAVPATFLVARFLTRISDYWQQQMISAYRNEMTQLIPTLQSSPSTNAPPDSEQLMAARTRTLDILQRLNGKHKGEILKFLYDGKLIGECQVDLRTLSTNTCQTALLSLNGADMSRIFFDSPLSLPGINLTEASLNNANLSHMFLSRALMSRANLAGADLTGTTLADAQMNNAQLSNATLVRAIIVRTNFQAASLENADLRGANLRKSYLGGAVLQKANLSNADLQNANLSNADLQNANLSNADLSNADLSNADLSNADLQNALLANADLTGVSLQGANFRAATYSDQTVFPSEFNPSAAGMVSR